MPEDKNRKKAAELSAETGFTIEKSVVNGTVENITQKESETEIQLDNSYCYDDNDKQYEVIADNIKDAAYTVYKNQADIKNAGYLKLTDNKSSYQEFALKEEAIWGRELDKRNYNNKSLFNHEISECNSINANINYSNLGNLSAETNGILTFGRENKPRELKASLGYKNSKDSAIYDNSHSAGLKLEFNGQNQKNNGTDFFETKVVCDNTKGKLDTNNVNNQTIFLRTRVGKEKYLLKDTNTELTKGYQISFTGGINLASNTSKAEADARIALEEGLQLQNKIGNTTLTNNISGGLIGDLRRKDNSSFIGVQPGVKLNGASGFTAKTGNITFGAKADGHAVITRPSIDYGVSGNIFGAYKTDNSNTTIFGSVSLGNVKQQLRLGKFNERTENETTIGTTIGAENKKGSVSLNYKGRFDKLNSTRDKSIVSLNAKVNL